MQRFKNILYVVTPGLNSDEAALARAVILARNNQARLTVIEIIDEIPANTKLLDRVLSSKELQAKVVAAHQEQLAALVAPWTKEVEIETKIETGIPFLETIHEVLQHNRDLVIKTAEGSGFLDRLFCSDDMHLLRKCPCPVWLVKPEAPKAYRRILAAVDVDDSYPPQELETHRQLNLQILKMASSLALSEFAELHVVNAWQAIGESAMRHAFVDAPEEKIRAYLNDVRQTHEQRLNALMDETINTLGREALDFIKPQIHLRKGSPRKEIPAAAEALAVDLVVMGTVARTNIPGFFIGNTAETILNRLNCSVLAIKPPGFTTPIASTR